MKSHEQPQPLDVGDRLVAGGAAVLALSGGAEVAVAELGLWGWPQVIVGAVATAGAVSLCLGIAKNNKALHGYQYGPS